MKNQKLSQLLSFSLIIATGVLFSCGPGAKEEVAQVNVDGIMFAMLRNLDEGVTSEDEVHGYAI
ncbi:MAG: hypothetical protein O7F74_12455, partial [Bacteroidetes bacterium]|nr:hypothetical protein [Bacteroidota bacterium]